MSESTVNFGLDVTTGDSTSTVDKLTESVEGLLEKYTKLMTAMGDGDKVFANVVKALGGHKGELDAATREIDKVQKAMSGGTAKAMTSDLGSEFKTLAQDLKTAFSGIPVEIKTATVQITGMATVMQNQLGGIGVTLRELKDSLLEVGNVADNTKRKTAQIQGKPKIEGQVPYLGTSLANKFNLEAKVQFKTEEDTLRYIQDIVQQADKLDVILKSAEKNELIDSVKARQAQSVVNTLKLSMTDLKVANIDMAGEAGRAMTELNSKISQTNTKLKEVKSITADKYVLSLKIDVPDIKDLKVNIAAMSQSVGTDTIKTSTLDQLISKQKELINLRKEAAYLKSAEDKTAVSAMLLPLQKEIGLRKDNIQKAKELNAVVAEQVKEFERSEATKKQKASEYFKLTSSWLKQQTLEQEQADRRKAVVAQNLAQAKLRIAAQEKTQTYTDEYKKAGDDLTKLGNLSAKITQELTEDQKNLGLVTRNATKETAQALKEELTKRQALVNAIKEQSAAQSLGLGASRGGEVDNVKKLQDAFDIAKHATEEFGKTSQGTIFQNIADMKSYQDKIKAVREELVKSKKLFEDPEILGSIDAQIKELDKLKESLKFLTKGLDVTGTSFATNTEAIRLKEEIDLLNKYQDITDRVRQAKEKLNQTKGSKSDTLQARKEMEALRVEQEMLKKEMQGTSALFAAAGMTGSKAMRDITNSSTKLNNEMASLKGTISTTESSFKNMWGQASMALGKLMLYYHSISVAVGVIKGSFSGMTSAINGIMTIAEPITNLEKALRMMNETGGGIGKTRKEMEYFKKTANDLGFAYKDLSEGFKQFKDIADLKGGNYEGIMNIWKQMTAAARATGQSGDLQDFYKGFTDAIGKGQIMTEELKKQLAQRLPGLIKGVEKEIASFRNIDISKFNIFTAMEKGTVKLSEFMAAFENFLPKWSKLGESMGDAYSASIARLSNAWTDLMIKIATGPTGSKIISIVEDMTAKLKDKDIEVVVMAVATSIAQIARYLTDIAENILPQIGQVVKNLPGINYDATVAAKNPKLVAAAQQSVSNISTTDLMWNTQQLSGVIGSAISRVLAADPNFAIQSQFNKTVNSLVSLVASTDADKLMASGWLSQNNKGGLVVAKSEAEAQAAQLSTEATQTAEGMAKTVFTPLSQYLVAVDGDMSKLNAKIEEALKNMRLATGVAGALSIESLYTAKDLAEFKKVAGGQSISNSISLPGYMREGSAPQIRLPKVSTADGYGLSLLSNLKSGNLSSVESAISASPDSYAAYNRSEAVKGDADSKIKALAKSLENIQDQINKASMGKWAYEFAQVTHKLKEFEIELGDKAAPQIAELGKALRKEFGENFTRGLDEFDTSLDMAIRSGKYGKELQTSFDAVTKTYKDNLKKIEDDYKGLSLVEVTQAELDKVAQLKTKAENAKVAGYEAAIESAIVSEKMLAKVQVQGAEKTIQEVMAIRNDEAKDVIEIEKNLVAEVDRYSQEGYNRKAANIDRAVQAEIKQGVEAVAAFKYGERKKQEELDKSLELRIASTENFTDYLNTRFAKEQGFFDNPTVATTKQFEKMYDVIGSGAAEIGQTIQESFTEAFTGTLKSWEDTWKSIQATFLKGLAEMIWVAKMRPIQLSIVSALTGMGTSSALAGGSTAGQVASQAHDMVTGGSQATTGEGVFSTLTKSITSLTKGVNTFGKDVLNMTSDLSNALVAGGIGFGVAKVMFPDNQMAQIGGAIGSAAGQVFGEVFGEEIGAALGPVGAIIGGVAGSMIGKLFQKETKVTDYGIRVSVDEQGLKFLDKYERLKKSGGFDISSIAGIATFAATGMGSPIGWQSGSKRDRYTEVDPQVYKQISAAITTSFSTVSRQMLSLGLAPNFAGFSIDEKVSLKGKDPEALLQAWLNKLSGKMVDTALANDSVQASFAAAKKMGETSSDALTRLVDAMTALESGAIKANVSIDALAGGLSGIDLASFASDFSEALGGSSNVSAFFDQISEFIGYVGIQGISNMTKFQEKFETAIGNINSYTGMSGSRTSTLLGQQTELGLTQSFIENKLEKFAAGAGWSKWLTFQDGELTMRPGAKYSTVEEMAAADPKWKAVLDPMIAYVKELKVTNQALENVAIKIDREATVAPSEAINASSATFWTDYTKALQKAQETGGMPPELASAWFAAGQVAEAMKEQRESAIAAREEIEKQTVSYNEQRKTLQLSAQYFGASANGLMAISREAEALNQNDLPTWFEESKNAVVDGLVPGLMTFNRTGETALDTLIRLTNVFKSTEQAAGLAGTNLTNLSGGLTGLGAANYAQGLADYFGDADVVSGIFQNISDAIYTDDESKDIAKAYWKNQAEAQAAALGTDLAGAKDWIKNQLANPLSAEQIQNINILATSINNLEDASGTSADAIDELADYMQDLTDKILTMGMTDTQEFIFNLKKEVKDMYDTILDKGGSEEQAQLAYKYQSIAIKQRLDETMKDINLSIRKLVSPDLIEQINQLSDSYWEQVQSATLLGATQEELNAILYNSYLQAKQVLASAANAYIAAYDSSVSKIEELKNKQQALEDDVDSARSDYMASLKKEIDLKQEAIDKIQENVDNLKDFITSLKDLKTELATSAGFLSPEEKAGVSLSEFYKTANLAAQGDTTAMGNLSSQAQAALSASEAGSYEDYIKTFASIYATASGLETSAQAQLDPQQLQLDALIASRDSLQTIYDEMEKLNDKTLAIDTARTAYEKAQIALANSTYQAQIDTAQAEVDRHTETVELLRKQYSNDVSLTEAANNFFTIKDMIDKAVPNQEAIAVDSKAIREAIEAQNKDFKELLNILDPDPTNDGTDTGIKTIVAAASVRDGVLLALREANTLETVNTTSVIGLLNSIKGNTTPKPPEPPAT